MHQQHCMYLVLLALLILGVLTLPIPVVRVLALLILVVLMVMTVAEVLLRLIPAQLQVQVGRCLCQVPWTCAPPPSAASPVLSA
jgi:hypothetical protein